MEQGTQTDFKMCIIRAYKIRVYLRMFPCSDMQSVKFSHKKLHGLSRSIMQGIRKV